MPDNRDDRLTDIPLPVWFNRDETVRLKNALLRFWNRMADGLRWPLSQTDPLTCNETLLNLLAWQNDITRFDGEPLALFRKRVKYAFINAQDAGSVAGFKAILARLDVGTVDIYERQPGIDWDIILLRLTSSQIATSVDLLNQIIRQYGRTCRRYQLEVRTATRLTLGHGFIHGSYQTFYAREEQNHGAERDHFRL
ncbi:TPA: hypothetical protein I8Y21_004605 [Klebsiella oxytoca]|uniref:Phage tail protein n=1 Tax=Klebsiella oxytoca TaxID=571 RepID=A0AAN5LBU8_KLEOX|nr:hypothetical protein [Klebsiella oxytoca]